MPASKMFHEILDQIQSSNLNFQLHVTPFSAQIYLRKSLVKDKAGIVLPPVSQRHIEIEKLVDKNEKLQNELTMLQSNHNAVMNNYMHACETIKTLEDRIKEELKPAVIHSDIKANDDETKKLKDDIEHRNEKIRTLENADKLKNETIIKLNSDLNDMKLKYNKEKENTEKEHQAEVKRLRKELGEEKKDNIKIRDKLKDIESVSIELKEKIRLKDDEIGKAMDEKVSLEEKMKSLLDVLYGCSNCGMCECECQGECYSEDSGSSVLIQCTTTEISPPPASETPSARQATPLSSGPSPWTPPPTPPCDSCGGVNYGPCPSKICFKCTLSLPRQPESTSSSLSRTPPGTAPLLRTSTQQERFT